MSSRSQPAAPLSFRTALRLDPTLCIDRNADRDKRSHRRNSGSILKADTANFLPCWAEGVTPSATRILKFISPILINVPIITLTALRMKMKKTPLIEEAQRQKET